ncbi:ABC transporter substrate-binding protein [Marinomonas communis]|uniref:Iron(III) transport system substrate-binding protein n=1 Tax=Marinomonas communis TaxID=28254 RepID=A0A4R6X9W4_9GAMM|nr:ABC transporter substrate-binding protein [Marinomonas communis]TDR14839.1 iron(III) transport system substrate-binding protein [Marinomonas communis]
MLRIAFVCYLFFSSLPLMAQESNLRIYSATDISAIRPLLHEFETLNPEATILYREFNTQELYDELLDPILPPPDVVISSASDLQVKLVNDGFAQPIYDVPNVSSHQPWAQWSNELFGFTYEPIVFVYNKESFQNRSIPHTHEALAEQLREQAKFYQGRIGTYDAASSGLGYLVASQDEVTFSLTGRLQESLGRARADIHCCTSLLLTRLTTGDLVFGYNLLGSYAMAKAMNNEHIGVIVPEDYALVIVRSAFVHRDAKAAELGADFIAYLRSPAGQQTIANNTALMPLDRTLGSHNDPENQLNSSTNFHPIRLAPELLLYLDQHKKTQFLNSWSQALGD